MSNNLLEIYSAEHKALIEGNMIQFIQHLQAPESLKEAMVYSLEAGGKRIRPLLVFAVLTAFKKDSKLGIPVSAAIEMIHTYSLIHDDLPSMDDDDLRRGKPTNHKVFGEAHAILAGDGLLTYSFQLVAGMDHPDVTSDMKLKLIQLIAQAAGAEGMVGGQIADMEGEEKQLSLKELEYIHEHKTGKLLSASVLAGAILSEANSKQLALLEVFSYHLGLAFQIRDDILDVEGDESVIGKPVGSDESNQKSTYPALLTMDGAKQKLANHIEQALLALEKTGIDTEVLISLTNLIADRNH